MKRNILCDYGVNLIAAWVRTLIRLRYSIEVRGFENLKPVALAKPGGILFLPNHPAEIDPVILMVLLRNRFQPIPLIVEHFYNLKGFRFFLDLVRAMPLPAMDIAASQWRAKKVKKQFGNVATELKRGENFLIYPAGKLKLSGLELIGGASFVHDLLQECPDANVVLIRTTGLWGSQFSKAPTGQSPDFGKTLLNCVKILLKNGIFFLPRRKVTIEMQAAPSDFPYTANRLSLNKYLERWYNQYPETGPEPLKLVSYSLWKQKFVPIVVTQEAPIADVELKFIPEEIKQGVFQEIARLTHRPVDQIKRQMRLSHDLGLDSLDTAQLYVFLDERYEVKDLIPGDLLSVEDVLQAASGYKKTRPISYTPKVESFSWGKEEGRLSPQIASGKSIQEVFLRSCDRMGKGSACVDRLSGLWSYQKLKMVALLLSQKMKEIPGEHVGVMIPATTTAYLVILAILLAKKIPVMINWTSGSKALDYAVELSRISTVVSSESFLDRLENGDLGKVEELFLFMEDLRLKITWKDKVKALIQSYYKKSSLMKKLKLEDVQTDDIAVLLFTSGAEASPKCVPLTHANLLSNQKAALEVAGLNSDAIFYGVLPPFHSFGFSVTGLLPLLAGIRVAYAPDPTDSHGLAKDIQLWKPTLFCCAPSFFKALFQVADPKDLQSLRLVVAGAEKAPQELFKYVKENLPRAQLIEGYGITECSPIITINRPNFPTKGVGKPISCVELLVIDSATEQPLDGTQEGELCIRGPGIFKGYLGSTRNPFVLIGGKHWYLSGDRGYLDPEGSLILSGRLKRFVKIGGEMVSLGGLEEEIFKLAYEAEWIPLKAQGPALAVGVKEKEGDKPQVILFTTFAVSKEDVNKALKESGSGRLVKIAEVKQLDQIPLTGTGKTHYRLLEENGI